MQYAMTIAIDLQLLYIVFSPNINKLVLPFLLHFIIFVLYLKFEICILGMCIHEMCILSSN